MISDSSSSLRILVAIASYGSGNDRYLARVLQEYRSMPFDVRIVVFSNLRKTLPPDVALRVVDLRGKDPWSLPFAHRTILADNIDKYDLFLYSEDDILITERNLRAFLRVQAALPENEIAGFFRYERGPRDRNFPDVHAHFHWDTASVRHRDEFTLAYFTNQHSGCYVLTREQLRRAIASRHYLVEPHRGRYAYPETAATDVYTQCGFEKLLCISHLEEFLVHHLPDKYVESDFGVDDQELRRQIASLLELHRRGDDRCSLFETETRLGIGLYSKSYYELPRPEILPAIPSTAHTALSIGCGWGSLESRLVTKGLQVAAIPLDPIIAGAAQAQGVEIISTELAAIPTRLSGRQFDCILLSNILHLIPNPVALLTSLRDVLSASGVFLIVAPNLESLPVAVRRKLGDHRLRGLERYDTSGVHLTSPETMERWLASSGIKLERIIHIPGLRAARIKRVVPGLLDAMLSAEFLAVASKIPDFDATIRCHSSLLQPEIAFAPTH